MRGKPNALSMDVTDDKQLRHSLQLSTFENRLPPPGRIRRWSDYNPAHRKLGWDFLL